MKVRTKFGFTLVELLVVIAIIGVLIALLLPAIQAAREAARRMQCLNKVKQVGLGLHNYHSVHDSLPAGGWQFMTKNSSSGTSDVFRRVSGFYALLPFMEQNALYENLTSDKFVTIDPNKDVPTIAPGTDIFSKIIDTFLCASDSGGRAKAEGSQSTLNYRLNFGDYPVHSNGMRKNITTSHFPCTVNRGPFAMHRWNNFSSITDGLSNTLFISERGVATENQKDVRRGTVINGSANTASGTTTSGAITGTGGGFANCLALKEGGSMQLNIATTLPIEQYDNAVTVTEDTEGNNSGAFVLVMSGKRWMDGALPYCGFTAILPPNAPSCGSKIHNATITPSAFHSGGVNVGMADGGGRFFSETVNYTTNYAGGGEVWQNAAPISGMSVHGVWGALGNRDGGESVAF
ncbi:MAG: DUF1559 domain-containing protein [Planctomycetaceae bacterium]|jgi:prepilin-type N-terminal cleavage/methylation domain-containing protein/prepilin-type processing-associated H-X9-DG protein|nr:DUF1559 domain-containing protein [Planctomycetaceae bacterium]